MDEPLGGGGGARRTGVRRLLLPASPFSLSPSLRDEDRPFMEGEGPLDDCDGELG